jgi:hypothetical protein
VNLFSASSPQSQQNRIVSLLSRILKSISAFKTHIPILKLGQKILQTDSPIVRNFSVIFLDNGVQFCDSGEFLFLVNFASTVIQKPFPPSFRFSVMKVLLKGIKVEFISTLSETFKQSISSSLFTAGDLVDLSLRKFSYKCFIPYMYAILLTHPISLLSEDSPCISRESFLLLFLLYSLFFFILSLYSLSLAICVWNSK